MRVAVVGSGVAGLSATWLLNEFSEHEVDLYESADYIGGHTHTVNYKRKGQEGEGVQVDTGFIVCNPPTYPNFLAFLAHLKIPTSQTEMTFSVSRDRGFFEWAGKGLPAVFCQTRNLLNPNVYRMVWDILRFNALAMKQLEIYEKKSKKRGDRHAEEDSDEDEDEDEDEDVEELSIGDFVKREGLSDAFRDDYLLPMTAAIWSTPPDKCGLNFPAKTLIRFMHNHHLLQVSNKPKWLVVKGGSSSYIPPILAALPPANLHLSTPIVSLKTSPLPGRKGNMVVLTTKSGEERVYDHVVMACHADQTLAILKAGGGVEPREQEILGGFEFEQNEVVLHGDEKLMPVNRKAWSAWNYLTFSTKTSDGKPKANVNAVSLTYCMNLLQHIPESIWGPVLVTLNPPFDPELSKVVGKWKYDHPMYTAKSVQCQGLLPSIQNTRGVTYVGAWTQYGFHEDGFSSSLRTLATHLGTKAPFPIKSATRPLPSTTFLTSALLDVLEIARQVLAIPFGWVSWAVLLVLGVVVEFLKKVEEAGGGGFAGGVREEVEVVRGFWASSSEEEARQANGSSKKKD